MASKLPVLMSVADLATAASVSTKTVRRWLESGLITGVRFGPRQIRVSVSSAMHLLRPSAVRLDATELAMNNDKKELVQLGPQLKYSREYTGEVDGVFVPLGTADQHAAKIVLRRTREQYSELRSAGSSINTLLLRKEGRPVFLKFRKTKSSPRTTKRIPTELAAGLSSDIAAETYRVAASIALGLVERATRKLAVGELDTMTLAELADAWFDGELARRFSAHLRVKRSVSDDRIRFDKYIRKVAGHRLIVNLTGAVAAEVADEIVDYTTAEAPTLSDSSRRHILQVYNRLLNLAVFPVRALERNDLPKGFLPKVRREKAFSYLYPDEELKLLECREVPVHYRLFFGLQAREGARVSELLSLSWKDVDLERGILKLDRNKTDRPRAWKMTDGTVNALKTWKSQLGTKALSTGLILVNPQTGKGIPAGKGARQLRTALKNAKVEREELFERSEQRIAIRAHDLRASFVTLALANGRSEAWVTDRTGHTTSAMLYRYKRAARTHAEAELGDLHPLDQAIPEFRPGSNGEAEIDR